MKSYSVLAYYHFTAIEDPREEVARQKAFFADKDLAGRIYISSEGVNCQMSGFCYDVDKYMRWLEADPRFSGVDFKIHNHHENVFPRMTVKVRKQLVAIDCPIDLNQRGEYLSPKEWREQLESGREMLLLDVRNDYESRIGHFEGATLPPCNTFREFGHYVDTLKERCDPQTTTVLMCCTGGIRCELYSALMKQEGFEKVYQLHGGIIRYGLEEGDAHWKGKLFVFDDRLAIPLQEESIQEPIAHCHHCNTPCDLYFNCANMHCNVLFICCISCLHTFEGCCQEGCRHAPGKRPYHADGNHKPFRRLHLLEGTAS